MEIAYNGHAHILFVQTFHDVRHGFGGGFVVHRHPHQLRAGAGQRRHLLDGAGHIGGIGIGHGLHHHRRASAYADAANGNADRFPALNVGHGTTSSLAREIRAESGPARSW